MEYKSILTGLCHHVIFADAKVNDKEMELARKMAKEESIDEKEFNSLLDSMKSKDPASLLADCVTHLKKLPIQQQIRTIAWLCVIANGDGFMDKEEWTLIYKVYHTQLRLSLPDVMEEQKELNKLIYGKAFQSIGVRVND